MTDHNDNRLDETMAQALDELGLLEEYHNQSLKLLAAMKAAIQPTVEMVLMSLKAGKHAGITISKYVANPTETDEAIERGMVCQIVTTKAMEYLHDQVVHQVIPNLDEIKQDMMLRAILEVVSMVGVPPDEQSASDTPTATIIDFNTTKKRTIH